MKNYPGTIILIIYVKLYLRILESYTDCNFFLKNVFKMLYHSLVSSHVNYCNIVWGFTTKKNIERINKLQKRGIRIITHSSYVSSSVPLFLKMKILPVSDLVSLQTALFMFRLRNNLLPEVFNHYFTLNCSIHKYKTRNAPKYSSPIESHFNNTIFYFLSWFNPLE